MQQHENKNKTLAKVSVEKSDTALQDAYNNAETSLFVTQNRAYYAIFYIVMALAYLDNFITKSHHKLMGQFNNRYIYQQQVFDKSLNRIYKRLIINREKSDYSFTEKLTKEQVLRDLEAAKLFVETVKPYILEKIKE